MSFFDLFWTKNKYYLAFVLILDTAVSFGTRKYVLHPSWPLSTLATLQVVGKSSTGGVSRLGTEPQSLEYGFRTRVMEPS
jgi:hypothetical protein